MLYFGLNHVDREIIAESWKMDLNYRTDVKLGIIFLHAVLIAIEKSK